MLIDGNEVSDKQLILGVGLFLLLFPLSESKFKVKRIAKKIVRSFKITLAKYRNTDSVRYLELVNATNEIMESTLLEIRKDPLYDPATCPGVMLMLLTYRYGDVFGMYGIDKKDIAELKNIIGSRGNMLFTMRYTNLLMANIEEYVKQDLKGVAINIPHSCDGTKYKSNCLACKYDKLKQNGYDDNQIRDMVSGYSKEQVTLVTELKNRFQPKRPVQIPSMSGVTAPYSVLNNKN